MTHCPLRIKAVIAVALMLAAAADAARILAVIPIPARSHHIAFSGVTKALADKGHDVTLVTALPAGNKINPANNKLIHVGSPAEAVSDEALKNFWEQKMNTYEQLGFLMEWGATLTNMTLASPALRAELDKPGQKYDIIITELFFFQEAFVGLGHQFNCPVVVINPFGTVQWLNDYLGNPVNPAWVPSPFLGFSDHMSFTQRAINALFHTAAHISYQMYLPNQQRIVDAYWPDAPPLDTMLRTRLGLALVNNHYTLAYPAPLSPNVVEIGGIHIPEKTKPLPKDLKDYLDAAKEGVLYYSMGSNLKMSHMPAEKRKLILAALGGLKERVLLKWDGPVPKDLSPNIRTIEWAPQGDLLAHPNIRAFFTHGGLLSTQESVYHGVPLIGMPMFGDQQFNMLIAVQKGFCVKVEFGELTRELLDSALNEVLRNPKYKQAATRLSRLFRSKPNSAEAAVKAVEHVLQHGADHMRPASVGMPLYQVLLLDVLLAAAAPFLVLLLCVKALCCGKKKASDAQGSAAGKRKKNN